MAAGVPDFPLPVRIEYKRDGSLENSFVAEVDAMLAGGKRKMADFSAETKKLLGQAFKVDRNALGAVDLDVGKLRDAARAHELQAKAVREVAQSMAAMQTTNGTYSESLAKQTAELRKIAQAEDAAAAATRARAAAVGQMQSILNAKSVAAGRPDLSFGVERLMDGKAAIDRAAVSGATLEQVLGRVASKGREVQAALDLADANSSRSAQQYARDLELVLRSIDPTREAQQRLDAELARAEMALERGAISAQEYGVAVNRAADNFAYFTTGAREGTSANHLLVNSTRSLRVATLQAGQQLQDVAISLYSGQKASVVFAQQLPQLAFALTYLEGSANKTHDRIGRFATTLSGPWGLAAGLAAGAAFELASALLKTGNEAEGGRKKVIDLSSAVDRQKAAYKELIDALDDYNDRQRQATENTRLYTIEALKQAKADFAGALALRQKLAAELDRQSGALGLDALAAQSTQTNIVRSKIDENAALIDKLQNEINGRTIELGEFAARATDPLEAIKIKYEDILRVARQLARVNEKGVSTIFGMPTDQYIANLEKQRKAEEDLVKRTTGAGANARDARVGDMVALIQQLFPGARITSMTGGRHTKDSDHYAGRAIDFVPAGGMGRYTTAEVEQILQDAGVDIRRNARGVKQLFGPGRGAKTANDHNDHFHVAWQGSPDPEKAKQALQVLQDFGDRASESIARISERFDEQPRLIDQAAAAARELDRIYADLKGRDILSPERAKAYADAMAQVQSVVLRDINRGALESEKQYAIQSLILQGRDREAYVMERIVDAQRRYGEDLGKHEALVRSIADAEYDRVEAILRATEMQNLYLDATRSVRGEVEAILSGQGKISNLKGVFKQLQGRVLAEQLFGDMFRDLDKWVKEKTGIGSSVDHLGQEVDRSASELSRFSDAVADAASKIAGGSIIPSSPTLKNTSKLAMLGSAGGISKLASNDNGDFSNVGEIVVVGKKQTGRTVNNLSPQEYFDKMSKDLGKEVTNGLNSVFDTTFFGRFSGVLGGALAGYATGGKVGGIAGLLKGIDGLPEGITDALGKIGKGAATGTAVSGIAGAFGVNLSNMGSQLGGAVGSFLPIPGGDIIGAIAGGIIGKLIGGTKRGSATIGGLNGDLGITGTRGNSGAFIQASSTTADSIIGNVERIADAFGASIDAALGSVSIGIRDGKYRVDATGAGITKTSKGAIDFGKNGAEAAAMYATLDLIKDGVVKGLRAGTQKLLQDAKDLDSGLQKALDFESVFNRLRAIEDPVGAALDTVDKEFSRLKLIAEQAGEGMVEVERLYGIERAKALKEANEQVIGSMRDLYERLTIGDSGLSLRARETAARAQYDPLAARVRAGDTSAYDDYVKAADALLDISRQLYGSQKGYFDLFDEVASLSKAALDRQQALYDTAAGSPSPFTPADVPTTDNASVVAAIDAQTDALGAKLDAANDNLGALIAALQSNGNSLIPAANFANAF